MTPSSKENHTAEQRAANEGMDALTVGDFLGRVIGKFYAEPALGLEEAAQYVAQHIPGMEKFAREIPDLEKHLQQWCKDTPAKLQKLQKERARRRLQVDKTYGGTPG